MSAFFVNALGVVALGLWIRDIQGSDYRVCKSHRSGGFLLSSCASWRRRILLQRSQPLRQITQQHAVGGQEEKTAGRNFPGIIRHRQLLPMLCHIRVGALIKSDREKQNSVDDIAKHCRSTRRNPLFRIAAQIIKDSNIE